MLLRFLCKPLLPAVDVARGRRRTCNFSLPLFVARRLLYIGPAATRTGCELATIPARPYTGPVDITLDKNGQMTFRYYSVDVAGNIEAWKEMVLE